MGIFLRHSWNVKPLRWGSFADVMYAIKVNAEKIYDCNPDNDVLIMPGFWGLPLLDYSGYNNHGTNHGATYKDGSLDFDGGDDYVNVGSNVNPTSFITVSVRLKLHIDVTGSNVQTVLSNEKAGDNYRGYLINILGGSIDGQNSEAEFGFGDGSDWSQARTDISLTIGDLYYIVGLYDGSNNLVYQDGELKGSAGQQTGLASFGYLAVGRSPQYATRFFNGIIDEVRISNVARTADQIALFHDLPWDLYRPVSRPVWSIPAAETGVQHFMLLGVG